MAQECNCDAFVADIITAKIQFNEIGDCSKVNESLLLHFQFSIPLSKKLLDSSYSIFTWKIHTMSNYIRNLATNEDAAIKLTITHG